MFEFIVIDHMNRAVRNLVRPTHASKLPTVRRVSGQARRTRPGTAKPVHHTDYMAVPGPGFYLYRGTWISG
jgi:hypothetical protein